MDKESLRQILALKASMIDRAFLHRAFNAGSDRGHLEPNTKILLDEQILKEVGSEFNAFKNAKELYGQETTFGRLVFNLVTYNIMDMSSDKFSKEDIAAREQATKLMAKDEKKAQEINAELAKKRFQANYAFDVDVKQFVTYKNFTLTAGDMEKVYKEMAELFIDGKITAHAMQQFIDNLNWLGFTLVPYMAPSMDVLSMNPTKEIKKIREDVFKEHKDIIDNNDVIAYNNVIEPKILKQAAQILDEKGSTGKMIFDSGVNGSFNGNYKITAVARGVVAKSDDASQYTIATSSLVEGVSKKEIATAGDIAVQGSLGRAIDTRQGGYKVKQFNAGFQSVVADAPGTDCGTPYTIKVTLDDKNYNDYLYRYVVERGQLVLLDRDAKSRYVGKTVDMRTPFFCQTPRICSKCSGEMIGKLGIKNIGLTSSNIGSALLNASLKAFHSLSVKTGTFDLEDFMTEI